MDVAKAGFGLPSIAAGVLVGLAIRQVMRRGLPVDRVRLTGWRNTAPRIFLFIGWWTMDFGARVGFFGEPGRVYSYYGIPLALPAGPWVAALAGASLMCAMSFVTLQQRARRPAPIPVPKPAAALSR